MAIPAQPPSQGGTAPSNSTVERYQSLVAQVRLELLAAISAAFSNAIARGYSDKELAAQYLWGPEKFAEVVEGREPTPTLMSATEAARVCGYRLHVTLESLDNNAVATPLDEIYTPFEVTAKWMQNHVAFQGQSQEAVEEALRSILASYFGQMTEKGYYLAMRGS